MKIWKQNIFRLRLVKHFILTISSTETLLISYASGSGPSSFRFPGRSKILHP